MSCLSMPAKSQDVLQLRVEWQDTFEGKKRRYLAVEIYVNGEHFKTYATDVWCLTHSTFEAGTFHFNTCTCGDAGCADIWNGVFVRHEAGTVIWYAPDHDGRSRNAGRILRHRVYRFEYDAYRQEVTSCLQKLAEIRTRKKGDILVTRGKDNILEFKSLLEELLASAAPVDALEGSPQDRLWKAIGHGDIGGAQCAMADGANLLLDRDNGESPWDHAVTEYACGDTAHTGFITELARYLPAPIPSEAGPDWLFDNIVEEGPAELLYQMTVRGGALPLNDERAQRCRERLESLRTTSLPAKPSSEADETVQWKESLDSRRTLLEFGLKREALERSIKIMRVARALSDGNPSAAAGLVR